MMRAFREVARCEAFSPAARRLGISASAMSRHIAGLEDWLGVQLFHRSTRHVRLTDAGQEYLARCVKILDSVRDLEQAGLGPDEALSGTIRVTAPDFYGRRYVVPILANFMDTHQGVNVELMLHDRRVDILGEGFDLALRITKPEDSSLIARRINTIKLLHVASPAYLKERGVPRSIEELDAHDCVIDVVPGHPGQWLFGGDKDPAIKRIHGRIKVNDGEAACRFAIAGFGIARLPHFFVEAAISAGDLEPIMEDLYLEEVGVYAVYPPSRFLTRPLRALIDKFAADLSPKKVG